MPISKVEVFFAVIAVAILSALVWSFADSSDEVGPHLRGTVTKCWGARRGTIPRQCEVALGSHAPVVVYSNFTRAGEHVVVVEIRHKLSGRTGYALARA